MEVFGFDRADDDDHLVAEAVLPVLELGELLLGDVGREGQVESEGEFGRFVTRGAKIVDFEVTQVERRTEGAGFCFGFFGGFCADLCRRLLCVGSGCAGEDGEDDCGSEPIVVCVEWH